MGEYIPRPPRMHNTVRSRGGPQQMPDFDGSEPCVQIGAVVYTHEDPPQWMEQMMEQACISCHLYAECLEWAVWREGYGYWAGTRPADRARMRRMRNIILESPEATILGSQSA